MTKHPFRIRITPFAVPVALVAALVLAPSAGAAEPAPQAIDDPASAFVEAEPQDEAPVIDEDHPVGTGASAPPDPEPAPAATPARQQLEATTAPAAAPVTGAASDWSSYDAQLPFTGPVGSLGLVALLGGVLVASGLTLRAGRRR